MSEVLYRKYRPKTFEEVIGERQVVSVLKAALEKNRISHGYLFSGPRGTGKTTVARIFARAVNCDKKGPCNVCELCEEFLSGRTLDLIEIDAASSRGIDEIRALKEAVAVLPFKAKYKVYIIDEVHMLTKEAFNALLKTLEEPPSHVIFILATTEPDKVPETIISRTQHFEFRLIPEEELEAALEQIVKKEGFKAEEGVLGIVATLAEGSLRDAQSILDQLLAYGDKELKAKDLELIFGLPPKDTLEKLTLALLQKDTKTALALTHRASEENLDMKIIMKLLMRNFRFLVYLKVDPLFSKELSKFLGQSEVAFFEDAAKEHELEKIEKGLRYLADAYPLFKIAYVPVLPLELAILKITS